jgi:Flp pilus assembly protein TadD
VCRDVEQPADAYAAFAEVNRRAAGRDATVGEECFTSHLTLLGEMGGTVHGWPVDKDYLPAFVEIVGQLPRFRRQFDAQGRPEPMQISGMSGSRFSSTREYFEVALREEPTNAEVLDRYGNWLKAKGRLEEAEVAHRSAIESKPELASAHNNLAIILEDTGRIDEAEAEYREAVRLDTVSPIYAANLAIFLGLLQGDTESGQRLLGDALERERNAHAVSRFAYFTDRALNDQETAIALFEEALAAAPKDPWINGRYGDLLLRRGERQRATERFELASESSQPDTGALMVHARLKVEDVDFETAKDLLRRALKTQPRNATALAMLAAVGSLTGAPEHDVERMYRQVLEWQPGHPLAALNLAQMLLQRSGGADHESHTLLHELATTELESQLRLELLFYATAYDVPGFDGAAEEIRELTAAGVSLGAWDFLRDLEHAERAASPHLSVLIEAAPDSQDHT